MIKDKMTRIREPAELLITLGQTIFITRLSESQGAFYLRTFDKKAFENSIKSAKVQTFKEVYKALFEAMYRALYKKSLPETLRCVSKTVLETEFFPELQQMFPLLKFIYVLRNPYAHFVSTVKSMRTHTGDHKDRVNREGMKLHWFRDPYPFLGPEISRMKRSYYLMEKFSKLYPDRFYVLVYDDLLKDPEGKMMELCRFLEIDFNPVLLKPSIIGETWGGNSWSNEFFTGINTKPLQRWKTEITPGEIRLLNKHFSPVINRFFSSTERGGSLFLPFHVSEYKPWVYLGNRMLYYWSL
jgi:hypothetical protein